MPGTRAYVAPFAVYIVLLAVERWIPLPVPVVHALRLVIVGAVVLAFSRPLLRERPSHPWASIAVGVAVFLIWIAPDLLFGYRHFWLFENSLTGKAVTQFPPSLHNDRFFLTIRLLITAGLVPIVEELFWRGWLMRWLIDSRDFRKVPLGAYQPLAFWLVAALFASEHGPFWEVGLLAGVVYNFWVIRTKNLADCILAHAVTNGVLAVYVLGSGQWQYWL